MKDWPRVGISRKLLYTAYALVRIKSNEEEEEKRVCVKWSGCSVVV